MAMFGVNILTPINTLGDQILSHKWYTNDDNVAGRLQSMLRKLNENGGAFVYNVTKYQFVQKVRKLFGIRC